MNTGDDTWKEVYNNIKTYISRTFTNVNSLEFPQYQVVSKYASETVRKSRVPRPLKKFLMYVIDLHIQRKSKKKEPQRQRGGTTCDCPWALNINLQKDDGTYKVTTYNPSHLNHDTNIQDQILAKRIAGKLMRFTSAIWYEFYNLIEARATCQSLRESIRKYIPDNCTIDSQYICNLRAKARRVAREEGFEAKKEAFDNIDKDDNNKLCGEVFNEKAAIDFDLQKELSNNYVVVTTEDGAIKVKHKDHDKCHILSEENGNRYFNWNDEHNGYKYCDCEVRVSKGQQCRHEICHRRSEKLSLLCIRAFCPVYLRIEKVTSFEKATGPPKGAHPDRVEIKLDSEGNNLLRIDQADVPVVTEPNISLISSINDMEVPIEQLFSSAYSQG
eukprot:Awhi_evm4s8331